MKIVGLTGGIATGKSTVSRWLERQSGVEVVDLDVLVRRLQTPRSRVVRRIAAAFPGVVSAEGVLDREALGALVFGDDAKRRKLNELMRFPIQIALLTAIARHWRRGTRVLVLDAPLLFETKLDAICALNVVVAVSSRETQLRRLRDRDSALDVSAASRRIDAQMPLAAKAKRADVVLWNDGSVDDLHDRLSSVVMPRLRRRLLLWQLNSLPGSLALAAVLFVSKTLLSFLLFHKRGLAARETTPPLSP